MRRKLHTSSTGHGTGALMPADLHTRLGRDRRAKREKKLTRLLRRAERARWQV